jgi:SAM-dependent methyltransferase
MRNLAAADADLYRFGLWVGLRTLPRAPIDGLKNLIFPVEYIRCAEGRYVLQHLDVHDGHRVLDVGSPKLLSLYLAARAGAEVYATDLLDYFFSRYGRYAKAVLSRRRDRYQMAALDGRSLGYPSESFDRAFSISAIEHIPGDGDSRAIEEIARILKPGGLACITVPWCDRGYVEEFKRAGDPDAYWAKSTNAEVFYQRAYDRPALLTRLLGNGLFDVLDLSFWGERRLPIEHYIIGPGVPKLLRWALLPAHFPLSRLFLRPLREREPSRKKVACLTLRKKVRSSIGSRLES